MPYDHQQEVIFYCHSFQTLCEKCTNYTSNWPFLVCSLQCYSSLTLSCVPPNIQHVTVLMDIHDRPFSDIIKKQRKNGTKGTLGGLLAFGVRFSHLDYRKTPVIQS